MAGCHGDRRAGGQNPQRRPKAEAATPIAPTRGHAFRFGRPRKMGSSKSGQRVPPVRMDPRLVCAGNSLRTACPRLAPVGAGSAEQGDDRGRRDARGSRKRVPCAVRKHRYGEGRTGVETSATPRGRNLPAVSAPFGAAFASPQGLRGSAPGDVGVLGAPARGVPGEYPRRAHASEYNARPRPEWRKG